MFYINLNQKKTYIWNFFLGAGFHWRRSGDFIINFEHMLHLFSNISIVGSEQVNVARDMSSSTDSKLSHCVKSVQIQ